FSSRRRHTRCYRDWSSDVCSSDLNTGEQIAPCGVPSSVGLRTRFSMKPALSHLLSMVLSIGACATNQLWLILSKHALRSPSNIHSAPALLLSTVWHCSIASAVERSLLNP